jgi:predicted nucleic acid-binding protein
VLVVDTSAILAALIGRPPDRRLVDRLGADGDLCAPHLLDVELLPALRRLVLSGRLREHRAAAARNDFADLSIARYHHVILADRIWALRHNLTAYDAAFVALAERLGVPLITCDAGLANAPGNSAEIELYEATARPSR